MRHCTCTVFARSLKLHSLSCALRQAHKQREQTNPSDRKAGKTERIKGMMKQLRPDQHFDEQLNVLLGVKKDTK